MKFKNPSGPLDGWEPGKGPLAMVLGWPSREGEKIAFIVAREARAQRTMMLPQFNSGFSPLFSEGVFV